MAKPGLFIVDGALLPEIFLKVNQAKEYLENGTSSTIADAVSRAGISRSAFYKYKDAVKPFRDIRRGQILTMSIIMQDKPGALSSVLSVFAANQVNILTINQSVPANGVGMTVISIISDNLSISPETLQTQIKELPSVIRLELLA